MGCDIFGGKIWVRIDGKVGGTNGCVLDEGKKFQWRKKRIGSEICDFDKKRGRRVVWGFGVSVGWR